MQLQLYGKKIWLYRKAIDFRCGIDGLSHLVVSELHQQPKEGIYLFLNRRRDKLKCLSWHKNGFVLCYKRLEKSCFSLGENPVGGAIEMTVDEMSWLLAGLEWGKMRHWDELNYDKFS
jgi:transposase